MLLLIYTRGPRLGEVVASNNVARDEELLSKKHAAEDLSPPPSPPRHPSSSVARSSALNGLAATRLSDTPKRNARETNIESLIQMMKSGMEVCKFVCNRIRAKYLAQLLFPVDNLLHEKMQSC